LFEGERIEIIGGSVAGDVGIKSTFATLMRVPAIIENKSVKATVNINAVLFITALLNNMLESHFNFILTRFVNP